ncbi:LOW QUALITY PROTEIN: uncharacterized protein LOC113799715 [Dermatophagoides pteronyssinus]|uniref:LOW QUALITY PROTEIN: uncharacterized protein LOC113799715 n=1 Tax=Dermatophagoides pteronyssinus TaxID=6956 RepID=UPI003F66D5C6
MKMYPRNRIDMIRWFLIQQITIKQWLQFITFILLMIQCFWQCFRLYKIYKKEYKQTSISYELPEQIEFPALTICIPIIIPFNSRCFDDTNSIISGNNGTNDDKQNRIECLQTPLTMLFNQSMSTFGHQCKIKTNRSSPSMIYCANISPIIENYYQNYRCYTYLSEITLFRSNNDQLMIPILEHNDFYVQILIQSNQFGHYHHHFQSQNNENPSIMLYLHQIDEIPIDSLKEFLTISMGRIYNINFNLRKTIDKEFFDCHNYSGQYQPSNILLNRWSSSRSSKSSSLNIRQMISRQECYNRCCMNKWRRLCGHCFPTSVSLRRDLIHIKDKFCSNTLNEEYEQNHNKCHDNENEMIEKIAIDCNHQCPKDCQKTDVELEVKEIENEDQGETMITIRRSIRPDKLLIQIPSISSVQYIGYIGGLLAFHLAIWWLICKFFELIEFIWEVYQLNCV